MFESYPDSASLMMIEHVLQLFAKGVFRQYDYGVEGNKIKYQSEVPPRYNVSRITAPVSLIYGNGDLLVTREVNCKDFYEKLNMQCGL